MNRFLGKILFVVFLSACAFSSPRRSYAIPACAAADVIAQEASCGPSGNCTITKVYDLPQDTPCVFDFSARNVTLAASARFNVGSGALELRAANFTMAPGALIDGQGTASSGRTAAGGQVRIQASGNCDLQGVSGNRSRIDVSANAGGGLIDLRCGGNISVNGRLIADNLRSTADGGTIVVAAGGNLTSNSTPQTQISAQGGSQAQRGGGAISLDAGGDLNLATNTILNVNGSSGGSLDLTAGGAVSMGGATGNASGGGGSGGTVTISAGKSATVAGAILLNGGTADRTVGGEGGALSIETLLGDIVLNANLRAEGSGPDGDGGEIDLSANGSIRTAQGVTISAKSNGSEGVGGAVSIFAALDLVSQSQSAILIDVGGGGGGGGLDIEAGRNVTLLGKVDVSGNAAGGTGGDVSIVAGSGGVGTLTFGANLDVSGGGCSLESGCGDGGTTDLSACDILVNSSATITANAPGAAGAHQLEVRKQLRVDGVITAVKTQSSGSDGSVTITHHVSFPPVLGTNRVRPNPILQQKEFCSPDLLDECLTPCPSCGNRLVEFPETCDDGNTSNCDGCSSQCQTEACPPAEFCPGNVNCSPQLGCAICPDAPTPTPTSTRTPTSTATPSATPSSTPTRTDTPMPTFTPTPTQTPLPTATATPTASYTASATRSPTPSGTPSATVTVTPSRTATFTPTPTVSPSSTPSLTPSATSTVPPTTTQTVSATPTPSFTPPPTSSPTPSPSLTPSPSPTVTPSSTPSQSASPSPTVSFTATPTGTPTPSPSATSTASPTPSETIGISPCPGDCRGDGEVTVDELLLMVNIALGNANVESCPAGDVNGDGEVTIDEILRAVNAALSGCGV